MQTNKAMIEKITSHFELKANLDLGFRTYRMETLAFRGLDLPRPHSKKGRALLEHLTKVIDSVSFMVVQTYEKNAFLRYNTDFFYLPGEEDPQRVAASGRCLNEELLEMDLAEPYDENKRKIDFSKRSIHVHDQDIDLTTGNFKAEVCMYINDCKQYLRAAIENRPVDMTAGEFNSTDEEFLIIYGLKELKDMCMNLSGGAPLDWKGN